MRRLLIFVLPALALVLAGCHSAGAPGQAARPAMSSQVAAADQSPAAATSSASITVASTPSLARDRGEAVRVLQRRLAALKYSPAG